MELPWTIETRDQASRSGKSKYFTGKECNRGHSARRYVSSGVCTKCHTENARKYQRNRRKKLIEMSKSGGRLDYTVNVHQADLSTLLTFLGELDAARGHAGGGT